jgi:sarcosine oxidase subunit beta
MSGRTEAAEAVVVGSGVMGASIALALSRRGMRVTVVDKASGPAQGSTAATSAIIRFTYSLRDSIALAWESAHMWTSLRSHVRAPAEEPVAGFVRTGMAVLEVPGLLPPDIRTDFDALGIPYEDWTTADLEREIPGIVARRFFPPVRTDDPAFFADEPQPVTALHTPDGGYISDPVLATENFVRAAQRAGARFRYGAEVVGIREAGTPRWELELAEAAGGVSGGTGTRTTLRADVVVNAAGPWSSRINAMAGVGGDHGVSLTPLRQEVHTVPAESTVRRPDGSPIPALLDAGIGTYMRPEAGGQLLIGSAEPECDPLEWLGSPEEAEMRVRGAQFEAQALRAAKRLSGIAVPNAPRGVVGVYDVASDWTPVYDRSSADGFYQAVGTSGNQFKNAPMVGELMACLIEAVESGHDHDADPVRVPLPLTGGTLGLGVFSRLRTPAATSGTVMG